MIFKVPVVSHIERNGHVTQIRGLINVGFVKHGKSGCEPLTVAEYIEMFPESVKRQLAKIRGVIRNAAPGAVESIAYKMPAYKLEGALVYFAAWAEHIGMYPITEGVKSALREELAVYSMSKGTVRFPLDQAPPLALIRKIVKLRLAENLARKEAKVKRTRTGRATVRGNQARP